MSIRKSLLLFGITACAVMSNALADDLKELRIGTEPAYAPFEYKDPQGNLTGFDVDVANAICDKLNLKCVWIEQPFDSLIPGLRARKFDLVHASMTVTEVRKKVVDFTVPIYSIASQLVARKGSDLKVSIDALKGKRVGVLQGSVQEVYARQQWGSKGVKIVPYLDQTQTFLDLTANRLDAALLEKPNAIEGFLNTDAGKDFEFIGEAITNDPTMNNAISMAARKGSADFLAKINQAIEQLQAEGTVDKLAQKYFKAGEVNVYKK